MNTIADRGRSFLARKRAWAVVTALVAGSFVLGLLVRGGGHGHGVVAIDHDHESEHEHGAATGEQIYYCPMHPNQRSTDPHDKCPICGMDLVPLRIEGEDLPQDLPILRVSERAAALMSIQTWPAERRAVEGTLRLFGRVDYDETRQRTIAAWAPGRLERLHVDFTGETVNAGDPMVVIYSPLLIAAQEELLQALSAAASPPAGATQRAEATLAAARDRLRLLGLSDAQLAEIEERRRVTDQLTIHSPLGGIVTARLAREGMYVQTGDPIYTITDLGEVWVNLEVFEQDLARVRVGQRVVFTAPAYPGEEFRGAVAFIAPVLDDRTRTVGVRVNVPNPAGRLKPGMLVRGNVLAAASPAERAPLLIPASAPLVTGQRAIVYVQQPDAAQPTFEAREVLLGPRAGDYFVVLAGLAEGELVVTNGSFKIDSELQIRGRPSMMAPLGGGAPATHVHGDVAAAAPPAGGHVHEAPPAAVPPAQLRQEPARPDAVQPVQVPPRFAEQVGQVVRANFALVAALAGDDPAAARAVADSAAQAIAGVDAELVTGADRDLWRASAAKMLEPLRLIAGTADIAVQRTHFEVFSDELTVAVRRFGTGSVRPVYRAMCPMVNDTIAYWLQPELRITNPYWGAVMFGCGDVVDTLAVAGPPRR